MNTDELELLKTVVQQFPLAAFLFYAWFNERKERIERTNQLVAKREEETRVQLQKEEEDNKAT
jgi:hypothetical protein